MTLNGVPLTLEIIASIFTLVCVYLTAKKNVLCWPIGMVAVLAFGAIYYQAGWYYQTGLQLIYFILSIIGWAYWGGGSEREKIRVNILPIETFRTLFTLTTIIGVIFGVILNYNFPDSSQPIGDSLSTVMALVATILLYRKYVDAWTFWVCVNIILTIMAVQADLIIMATLEILLLIISIITIFKWQKNIPRASS